MAFDDLPLKEERNRFSMILRSGFNRSYPVCWLVQIATGISA
jgi:hypothetical protein